MLSLLLALAALLAGVVVAPRSGWRAQPLGRRLRWLLPGGLFIAALVADGGFVGEKAIARLIMPTGLLWLAGYLGVVRLAADGRRGAALVAGVLWLGFTAAGNLWVGGVLLRALEAPFRVDPVATEAPLDAVLLLGGGTAVRPDGEPQLGPAGDRVRVAARLQRQGRTRFLITSGTSVAGLQQAEARDLAQETRTLWLEMGVPAAAIITLPGPRNTREEIAALQALAVERGWRHVGLVTSAWHLPRALALGHAAGMTLVPFGADFRGEDPVAGFFGLIPSANGFYRVQTAAWEYLGRTLGR